MIIIFCGYYNILLNHWSYNVIKISVSFSLFAIIKLCFFLILYLYIAFCFTILRLSLLNFKIHLITSWLRSFFRGGEPATQARVLTGNWTREPLVPSPRSIHWATPVRADWDLFISQFNIIYRFVIILFTYLRSLAKCWTKPNVYNLKYSTSVVLKTWPPDEQQQYHLLEMHILGHHLLNCYLWGQDPAVSLWIGPPGGSDAQQRLRTTALGGPPLHIDLDPLFRILWVS